MNNKNFCMSSYLAFRYIEREGMDFYEGLHHENIPLPNPEQFTYVHTALDIDKAIQKVFDSLQGEKLGICLSGGMDSAILAAYMPGCDAYTFRFLGGEYQKEELARAEYYAKYYGLNLHYVDIDWNTVQNCLEPVMRSKNAPVHSIEPQLYQAAMQAKEDGVTHLIIGDCSDVLFGGLDQLLSKDWKFIDVKKRIFAGVSVYPTSENCKKFIKCAELKNGEVAYGDLIIEPEKPELLPCPFCGKENPVLLSAAELDERCEDDPVSYTVCCEYDNGGCGACGGYRETETEAIEAWNKRG